MGRNNYGQLGDRRQRIGVPPLEIESSVVSGEGVTAGSIQSVFEKRWESVGDGVE